jgi:hypothetical protein
MSFRRWQKLSERMTENVVLMAGAGARDDASEAEVGIAVDARDWLFTCR